MVEDVSKVMRILLANHTPLVGSGSGTYTAMLAQGLKNSGHHVCVLSPLASQFRLDSDVDMYDFNWGERDFPSFTGHPLSFLTYDRLDSNRLRRLLGAWRSAICKIRKEWKPDIAHVQHIWVTAKAASLAGFRPVVTCHGSEISFAVNNPRVVRILMPKTRNIGAVIFVSKYVHQLSECLHEQKAEFKNTLPNPYNDELFYFRLRRYTARRFAHLGFVGRLVSYKNGDQFLECLARLKRASPKIRGTIVGDGPDRRRLLRMVAQLGLVGNVLFTGQLDQRSLRRLYQNFDALLVPSDQEPFGLVVLEAAACGTPVVVAQSGALSELIHPPYISGYESSNVDDMITQVTKVLSRPYDARFGIAASTYVQNKYSLKQYIQRLERIYENVYRKI
jgi:glycosyltransferase involved in cell wall biosynthesis